MPEQWPLLSVQDSERQLLAMRMQLDVDQIAQAKVQQLSAYLLTQQTAHASEKQQLQAQIARLQHSERQLRAEVTRLRSAARANNGAPVSAVKGYGW